MRQRQLHGTQSSMVPQPTQEPRTNAPRSGFVEVTLRDGRTVSHFTRHPPGTKENPLDTEGVNAKVRDLMAPVLGAERTEAIIQRVNTLEELDNVRALRPLLTDVR